MFSSYRRDCQLFDSERAQVFLALVADSETLDGLANREVVDGAVEPFLLKEGQRGLVLLDEREAEIPGLGHVDVVVVVVDAADDCEHLRVKVLIEKELQLRHYAEADGERVVAPHPAQRAGRHLFVVPGKNLGPEAVAHGPVVDVRQETLDLRYGGVDAGLLLRHNHGVQHVLFVIVVRQTGQEVRSAAVGNHLLGKRPQLWHTHSDDALGFDVGNQADAEVAIFAVLQINELLQCSVCHFSVFLAVCGHLFPLHLPEQQQRFGSGIEEHVEYRQVGHESEFALENLIIPNFLHAFGHDALAFGLDAPAQVDAVGVGDVLLCQRVS